MRAHTVEMDGKLALPRMPIFDMLYFISFLLNVHVAESTRRILRSLHKKGTEISTLFLGCTFDSCLSM